MIKILSILFVIAGLSAGDKPKKQYPRKGIIYDFAGCTVNYDIDAIYCVA
jgi:hypothetical protein